MFDFGLANGFVVVKEGRDGHRLYTKTYERATIKRTPSGYAVESEERTKALTTLEFVENRYSNDNAKKNLDELFEFTAFDYTKPVELLKTIVEFGTDAGGGDIVLDFFAGSSTTAQGVIAANAADGGNRRFIMIQMDEPTNEASEARNRGFSSIAELSRERIRRAGKLAGLESSTAGFRALAVDSTNMASVWYPPDDTDQAQLAGLEDSVKPDRSGQDLLFQVLIDWGLDLTLPISVEEVDGRTVFVVDDGALIACFDGSINTNMVRTIAKQQPLRVVFRDSGFGADDAMVNVVQIFRELSPLTDIKVL